MRKTDLELRTKNFALAIIALVERMPKGTASSVVGRQLLRSGTSIGANYREGRRAESREDFVHKIKIATKEAAETEYWLELINESQSLQTHGISNILGESDELLAIFTTIVRNAKHLNKTS